MNVNTNTNTIIFLFFFGKIKDIKSNMGVESGGRGRVPRSRKISGGRPPKSYNVSVSFS